MLLLVLSASVPDDPSTTDSNRSDAERPTKRSEAERQTTQPDSGGDTVSAPQAGWRWPLLVPLAVILLTAAFWARTAIKVAMVLGLLAVFFAYFLAPVVEAVRRRVRARPRWRPISHAAAIGLLYAVLGGTLIVAWLLLAPRLEGQVRQLGALAPSYLRAAADGVKRLDVVYRRYNVPEAIRAPLSAITTGGADFLLARGLETLDDIAGLARHLPWLALVPVLTFFLLNDAPAFRRSALRALPHGHLQWRGDEFLRDVNTTLAGYIRAQLTACLIVGIACMVGFTSLGVSYALPLGIAAGVLEFFPVIGPLTVALIVLSAQPGEWGLAVLGFLLVLRVAQDYFVYPRLIGRGMHLHSLAVILAILAGAELGGIVGVFLAIPVVGMLAVSLRHWREYRAIEDLVSAHAGKNAAPEGR